MTSPALMDTGLQQRRRVLAGVSSLVGVASARAIYMPSPSEGLTAVDGAVNSRVWTHPNTPTGRLSQLGKGTALALNGTSDFLTAPDATDLSFGDGSTDVPFSVVVLANVTDTAAARGFVAKNNEYAFNLSTTDVLTMSLVDASAAAVPSRAADVATTRQGTWAVYGGTYSKATGGATAANDITLYENGAVVASTATNAGAYVAMEDGASVPTLAALNGGASSWMPGRLAFVLVAQKNMSAADHAAITQLLRSYAGL